jgi:hypothetical protein
MGLFSDADAERRLRIFREPEYAKRPALTAGCDEKRQPLG